MTQTTLLQTPSPLQLAERAALRDDPLRFGVGARLTIAVMSDRYADIILGALAAADTADLIVETGDVSTFLGGDETALLRCLTDVTSAIAGTRAHASISILLSRGCPGEVECALPGGAGPRAVEPPTGRDTGRYASAEWALYPLADEVTAGVEPDHMRDIHAAIDLSKDNGTFRGSAHFVTRLEGDAGRILETVVAGWTLVGRSVQHVTSHLTLSLNSPSHAHVDA
ncbi:Ykof family thiamine-binding protein [Microbacterium aerolatum]|uniref:YkoF family thiamine/hydroxymethylpyrimidine-binding protein n=1 Tax=Microbacterium aerolatum TaxID=153731 RepID=UPI00384FB494